VPAHKVIQYNITGVNGPDRRWSLKH